MGWLRDTFGRLGGAAATTPPPAPAAPNWRKLGNDALGAGQLAEAARCYEQGILADPQDAALRLNLGFVLLEQGQAAAAAARLEQAIALRRPGDDCAPQDAWFVLGRARVALGQLPQAVDCFAAALAAQPEFPEALEEGSRALQVLERHAEAVDWLQRLLPYRPGTVYRLALASELRACDRHAEAAELLEAVCAQDPRNIDASALRFAVLMKAGRPEAALAEAERTLAQHGPLARFLVNRAVALERLGRHEETLASVDQALALEPGHRDALANRATTLTNLLRLPESIAASDLALQQYPDDADLHFSLSLALLMAGRMERGWAEHEWRRRSAAFVGKVLEIDEYPLWRGEDLAGRTIFLHGEQGIGDNIQFARFANVVAAKAGSVVLMVSHVVESLVARSLAPNCRILPQNSPLPQADFHCPLMSLPAVLRMPPEEFSPVVPYLRALPEAARGWRDRLEDGALHVGIAWAGNPKHLNDHNRSLPLEVLRAVDDEGCQFVTVQPDVREQDRALLASWPRAADLGRGLRTFEDTAALVEALDLVITVDTSVAHLAGALGKPVWLLLAYVPDWRWMLEREDSPWYPTARLYRQPARGDWASVVARVRRDLAALAQARRGGA